MTNELWINLPVKNVNKSLEFFLQLGFSPNPNHGRSLESASIIIGNKNIVVMLFDEATFARFSGNEISNVVAGTEVLFSIDVQSRDEVDSMAAKVKEAGGVVYGGPMENYGWLYGCGFIDLDGHRWNILHMDMNKMPSE